MLNERSLNGWIIIGVRCIRHQLIYQINGGNKDQFQFRQIAYVTQSIWSNNIVLIAAIGNRQSAIGKCISIILYLKKELSAFFK